MSFAVWHAPVAGVIVAVHLATRGPHVAPRTTSGPAVVPVSLV